MIEIESRQSFGWLSRAEFANASSFAVSKKGDIISNDPWNYLPAASWMDLSSYV